MMTFTPLSLFDITKLRSPYCAALVFGLIGCAGIAFNTYSMLGAHADSSTAIAVKAATPAAPPPSFDIAAISALNLFGKIFVEPTVDPATLPPTQLNLKLTGVFVSTDTEHSRALIAEEGKPAKAYFTGDLLSGGARLHNIDNDFVIIERGERLEKLPLHADSIATVAPSRHVIQLSAALSNSEPSAPSPQPAAPGMTAQNAYKGLEDRLTAIRRAPPINTP